MTRNVRGPGRPGASLNRRLNQASDSEIANAHAPSGLPAALGDSGSWVMIVSRKSGPPAGLEFESESAAQQPAASVPSFTTKSL